ncbi:hypothetical protein ET532_005065 [Verminephrobacter sp. Larva24]|nr:hypothetical protein ET532_005065 [Verminephrobacter sp. Larva24]
MGPASTHRHQAGVAACGCGVHAHRAFEQQALQRHIGGARRQGRQAHDGAGAPGAQPIPSVLVSDATPRCASMASADRQMIGDATLVCASDRSPAGLARPQAPRGR